MDHFTYRQGILHAEGVPLPGIAASVGTPFYVYSAATLRRHFQVFDEALHGMEHLVCYAVKANSNIAVLKLLGDMGAGMDVVSAGEYRRARAAGVPGERIVFSGVGKTREEMRIAVAASLGVEVPVTLRINPDVDAKTHEKIATGKSENKFGIPLAKALYAYGETAKQANLRVVGIDVHIGSQLTDLAPYRAAYTKVAELAEMLRAEGHEISRLDLGGGLGIPYEATNDAPPLPAEYGDVVRDTLGHLGCEIEIEPGRLIAGNAGLMVARVIYVKQGAGRKFLILDAAMNDLVRPAMYEAHHDIVPVAAPAPGAPQEPYDIVGPVCETGDTFARGRNMTAVSADDLIAFRSAGAYGAVMASEYNSRPLIPEVLVDGEQFAVIRRRPSFEDMIAREAVPAWL